MFNYSVGKRLRDISICKPFPMHRNGFFMEHPQSFVDLDLLSVKDDLAAIRAKSPLVHNITNYVVMNNTANALLAIGASPVMAHAELEVADMVKIASSLVINIGTLSEPWVRAMISAGKTANYHGKPIVLDPVGAGATKYRTTTSHHIIKECKPQVIRGNASEILSLVAFDKSTKGVDSVISSDSAIDAAMELASENDCVVVISGEIDYIIDKSRVARVFNGNPMMAKVTGLGCTASAMVGAFCAVDSDYFKASANAMAIMGIAGDMAVKKSVGPGSLQMNFIDQLYNLTAEDVKTNLIKKP